jgi:Zn-dependent protease
MNNPRWDFFASVAAGPLCNLIQACVYAILLRICLMTDRSLLENVFVWVLLTHGVATNLALCFFNLIPFGPLDGHWLLGSFLPDKQRYYWYRFNAQIGMVGLFGAVIVCDLIRNQGGPDVLWAVMGRPIAATFHFLTGIQYG